MVTNARHANMTCISPCSLCLMLFCPILHTASYSTRSGLEEERCACLTWLTCSDCVYFVIYSHVTYSILESGVCTQIKITQQETTLMFAEVDR